MSERVALRWTPTHGPPRRVRIVERDDALGMIEEEHTGCGWRPLGREPVEAFDVAAATNGG